MQLRRVAGVNTTCASHLDMLQLELRRGRLRQRALELARNASPFDDVSALFASFCEMLCNSFFVSGQYVRTYMAIKLQLGFVKCFVVVFLLTIITKL